MNAAQYTDRTSFTRGFEFRRSSTLNGPAVSNVATVGPQSTVVLVPPNAFHGEFERLERRVCVGHGTYTGPVLTLRQYSPFPVSSRTRRHHDATPLDAYDPLCPWIRVGDGAMDC